MCVIILNFHYFKKIYGKTYLIIVINETEAIKGFETIGITPVP